MTITRSPKFAIGAQVATLKHHSVACILVIGLAVSASAQTPYTEVPTAFENLISELERSPEATPNVSAISRITASAQDLQRAINLDGGARPALSNDATNIVRSLQDKTFSARGSLDALRRDAATNVVSRDDWHPRVSGDRVSGTIGTRLNQTSEGDCVGISVVKAFANTTVGADILQKAVSINPDGSFTVSLPGDPSGRYHVGRDDLDQFGKGDAGAAAVVGALFQYFHLNPKTSSLPTNKVMELLAGTAGEHFRLADAHSSPSQIEQFLKKYAPLIGRNVAMVFGGAPNHQGDWSKGDGHAFAIIHVDIRSGTLIYTNPWDESKEHIIPINTLAGLAAGTSADFEMVKFR